jgi:hypothetical protein
MPEIYTGTANIPFQAGYKAGKTARQMYNEEKAREDAKIKAQMDMQRETLNFTKQKAEYDHLEQLAKLAQEKVKGETELMLKSQEANQKISMKAHDNAIAQGLLPNTSQYDDFVIKNINAMKTDFSSYNTASNNMQPQGQGQPPILPATKDEETSTSEYDTPKSLKEKQNLKLQEQTTKLREGQIETNLKKDEKSLALKAKEEVIKLGIDTSTPEGTRKFREAYKNLLNFYKDNPTNWTESTDDTPMGINFGSTKQAEINARQITEKLAKLPDEVSPFNDTLMKYDDLDKKLGFSLESYNPTTNDIEGVTNPITGKRIPTSTLAAELDAIFQDIMNSKIKEISGAQTSIQEIDRNLKAFAKKGTFIDEGAMMDAFKRLKNYTNNHLNNVIAGQKKEVIQAYIDNGGNFYGKRNDRQKWIDDYKSKLDANSQDPMGIL